MSSEHGEGLAGARGPVSEDGAVEAPQQSVENILLHAFVEDLPVGCLGVEDAVEGVAEIPMRPSADGVIASAADEDTFPAIVGARGLA